MQRDFEYEHQTMVYTNQYPQEIGGGIKCKNHEVCGTILPNWWWDCKHVYTCTTCNILFGKILTKIDSVECPLCLECKQGITYPNCDHAICIDCFKRCFYGDKCLENEPTFPYPDIEDEYYEDPHNPKWKKLDYVLIGMYHTNWNRWDENRMEKYNHEYYLRKCSLCRK